MSMSWEPPRRYIQPTFADYAADHDRIYRDAYDDRILTADYGHVRHNTRSLDEHYNTLPEGVRK